MAEMKNEKENYCIYDDCSSCTDNACRMLDKA